MKGHDNLQFYVNLVFRPRVLRVNSVPQAVGHLDNSRPNEHDPATSPNGAIAEPAPTLLPTAGFRFHAHRLQRRNTHKCSLRRWPRRDTRAL